MNMVRKVSTSSLVIGDSPWLRGVAAVAGDFMGYEKGVPAGDRVGVVRGHFHAAQSVGVARVFDGRLVSEQLLLVLLAQDLLLEVGGALQVVQVTEGASGLLDELG